MHFSLVNICLLDESFYSTVAKSLSRDYGAEGRLSTQTIKEKSNSLMAERPGQRGSRSMSDGLQKASSVPCFEDFILIVHLNTSDPHSHSRRQAQIEEG